MPQDFCPGDLGAEKFSWGGVALHRIRSADHPAFAEAYDLLWRQFSPADEMEMPGVIRSRLDRWKRAGEMREGGTFYEMVLLERGGEPVAVRDHTVIFPARPAEVGTVVHLSHNLVLPGWRRSGAAAWMRAVAAASAREILAEFAPARGSLALVLAAEMERLDPRVPETATRLAAYEKAGFRMADPARAGFLQPDFRPPEVIARTGLRPIPLRLLLRICGRENAAEIGAGFLREIACALYEMYALELDAANIAEARKCLAGFPLEGAVRLLPPRTAELGEDHHNEP